MNPATDPLVSLENILSQKNSGIICLPENPPADSVAAALALYSALMKMGKNISLVCSTSVKSQLPEADKIQSSFTNSGNNLVVSLPYEEGSIDKVDYNIQGDYFNLIVTPKEGFPKLNSKDVKFSYTGGDVDFIITVDSPSLKALGPLYIENQKKFQDKKAIINIDRHLTNSFFGSVNLVSKTVSSTSEIILSILKFLNCQIDRDIATDLYAGLVAATNNFSSFSVNAGTFETAAELMKLGALKKGRSDNLQRSVGIEKQKEKPIDAVEKEIQLEDDDETPEDWLKPKIFRSKNLS